MSAPPCFDSGASYMEWLSAAHQSRLLDQYPHAQRQVAEYEANPQFHIRTEFRHLGEDGPREPPYCTDCTPEYRNRMIAQQRCSHPRTQFLISSDYGESPEVVGVRVKR